MPQPQEAAGQLSGIRVLDLTSVIAGPYATALLGDLGAEIIKVEAPAGDISRDIGPRHSPGMSAQFMNYNRNKRSVVIDLKTDAGRATLYRMVEQADVFIVNMRPQALRKLGIAYEDIHRVRPDIVYCRVVGFSPTSPDADRPALDDVIQAAAGLVYLQGELTGSPSYVGMAIADMVASLMAWSSVLAALLRRERGGGGDEIEVRMYDVLASMVLSNHLSGSVFVPPLSDPLYGRSVASNRKPFLTLDGAICASPYTDRQWAGFLEVIGRPDLMQDPRFSTVFQRSENLNELYAIVEPLLLERSSDEWIAELIAHDVPAGPVRTTADLLADPSLSELIRDGVHPTEGPVRVLHHPVQYTNHPASVSQLPPRLGAHTDAILAEFGFSTDEIDALRRDGVVGVVDGS